MLDQCNTLPSSSIILGDINAHFYITTNPVILKINSLLNRYSFYQAVIVPTHRFGHTLYIVMFRPNNDIVCSTTVTQLLLSVHYCVVCDLSTIKPVNHAELIQSRNLRGINLTNFEADICQLISPTLCPTLEMLEDSLRLILEKHAPLRSCREPINRNDPWHNAMKSDIIVAKKHRHWAEIQYLKYPTILNKQQSNKAKNSMVTMMHKAKSKFYLSEINSATSKKSFFATYNKLLGLKKLAPFPNIYLIDQLPAIFYDFLLIKLNKLELA